MVTGSILLSSLFLCALWETDGEEISNGLRSKLSKYTVVYPHVTTRWTRSVHRPPETTEKDEKESVSYALEINNRTHLLHLTRNRGFISKNFVQHSHNLNGDHDSTHPRPHVHCYYHGLVEGYENSLVMLSTCSGLRGVILLGNSSYGLEPVPRSPTREHLLYLLKDVEAGASVCGVADDPSTRRRRQQQQQQQQQHSTFDPGHTLTSHLRRKRNLPQTSYVELVLVVDNLRYKFKKENETAVREEMVEMANLLDGYYKQLNIRVVLVGLEIFKSGNPFDVEGSAGEALKNFVEWRKARLLPRLRHDVGQLIVGLPNPYGGNVLGMAFVGTICSAASSGGITVFSGNELAYASTVVAHEMGHNLGMSHDAPQCTCNGGSCIMAASASGSTNFSTCSGDDFEQLVRRGRGLCLKNPPSLSDIVGIIQCGNGLLEDGEQCDCGTPEECKDKCCNAATCRFSPGATCAQGSCCSNCRIIVAGTPCRASDDTCDLPEYCDGRGAFCPEDFYIMDGLPCENNAAYCYEGHCQTYEAQCKRLFQPGATKADDICYRHANTMGDKYGNCGFSKEGKYIKCSVENSMCGKVQCTNLDANKPPPGSQITIQIIDGLKCVNADFNLGSDVLDPAYVNPGSPCAEGKTCLDFKCVNASGLLAKLDCDAQRTCNGRGVCNDQGHCHCDNGWAPPNCAKSGRGGSVDSGPAQKDHSLRNGLMIFFLLVVPVVVVVILSLLYFFKRSSLQKCCKGSRASNYRSRNEQDGQANGQTDVNIGPSLSVRPPVPSAKEENPPDAFASVPGFRYGELDYWNTASNSPVAAAPVAAPQQGPGVPKPIQPKQLPN